MLEDTREDHQTDPPTLWFVGNTNNSRRLKVVFIHFKDEGRIQIKTCYEANAEELRIYEKYRRKWNHFLAADTDPIIDRVNVMKKIKGNAEAWESGELGRDEKFVSRVEIDASLLDEAAGLKSISVRMPTSLIEDLKNIGQIHGLGYQPLMKQILSRFVEAEKKRLLKEAACKSVQQDEEETNCSSDSPDEPKASCG